MDNPGTYTLFVGAITAALAGQVQTPITELDGILSGTIVAQLLGAAGGSSISALVQTSIDGGTTWVDVARFDFTTSAVTKYANLSGLTAKAVTAYAALGSEGVNDGMLGSQFRAVLTSIGTYTNTTLSLRLLAR